MSEVLTGKDIIIISQQPWDTEIGSNCKNIAVEFSKTNRVLYINSPLDRKTLFRDRNSPGTQKRVRVIKRKESSLYKIGNNIWNLYPDCILESINWIKSDWLFDVFNRINNKRFASSIKRAIVELGFKDFILFNDNEMFKGFYLKEFLNPSFSIYYSRDYMVAVDYWKKHGEKLEPRLIQKSDLCVANSTFLAEYCAKFNANSFFVGQGCEVEIPETIDEATINDLRSIDKPIIGYVGALQSIRLDIETLYYIAFSRPDWSIVLIGPEDASFKSSSLHDLPNVHFLGLRPTELLGHFIRQFAVCINPQLVNLVTIGNYPRKIDEYLCFGKPTVATRTKAMEFFDGFVYLAENKDEFINHIEKALSEDSVEQQEQRIHFARSHSWPNCVEKIYEAYQLVCNRS